MSEKEQTASDYFAKARLTRQTSRDEALNLLKTAASSSGASQETIDGAMAEMSGRTRKYYHITSSGLSLLKTEEARWAEYARGVDAVLGGAQNLA